MRMLFKITRDVIHEWAEKFNGKVVEPTRQHRAARSIVNGVTRLCDEYGRVIVLEDDMLISPHFLDYMITALNAYQDEEDCADFRLHVPVRHHKNRCAFFSSR